MPIKSQLVAREQDKFVESQDNPGFPLVAVGNWDGSKIAGGGAGVQYNFGSLASTGSGTVAMGQDPTAHIWPIQMDASKNLLVNINVALPSGNNLIGGVSVYGNLNANLSGVISLASGQYIGIAANSSLPSINGTVTNAAGSNFIGLVSAASIQGSVAVNNLPAVISLASGQYIGIGTNSSLPSINGTVGLAAGANFIGLVSLASVTGLVQVNNVASLASSYGIMSLTPTTTGGWTPYSFASLTNTPQQVKSAAGELGGYYLFNSNATYTYVQIFDIANSSVSLGVRAPTLIFGLPAGGGANLEAANGINFATAIQIAATTTPNGNSAPTNPTPVSFWYK